MSGGRRSQRSRPARGPDLTRLHANGWRRPLRSSPRTSSSTRHPRAGNPRRCPPRGLVTLPDLLHITRREAIRPPVATLVEFLTLSRLTHSPLRRNGRLEVVPLAGGRVVQADITELGRPGRDEPQLGGLGSFAGFDG